MVTKEELLQRIATDGLYDELLKQRKELLQHRFRLTSLRVGIKAFKALRAEHERRSYDPLLGQPFSSLLPGDMLLGLIITLDSADEWAFEAQGKSF